MNGAFRAPLAPTQRVVWVADRANPGAASYRIPLMLRLEGALNAPALTRALQRLTSWHEALRTSFVMNENGEPEQCIWDQAQPGLLQTCRLPPQVDLQDAVDCWLAVPLDTRQSCVRAVLAHIHDNNHLLFLDIHHLVCDGWSVGVLAQDLGQLYRQETNQEPLIEADPERYQFEDWAEWQRGLSADPADQAHWSHRLQAMAQTGHGQAGLFEPPGSEITDSVRITRHFSGAQWLALVHSAQTAGLTPFEWTLAAFASALSRMLGQADVPLVTPWTNRTRDEFTHTVGCLTDVVLLTPRIPADQPFADVARELASSVRADLGHAQFGSERLTTLWRAMQPVSGGTLADVMFALQQPLPPLSGWPGLSVSAVPVENHGAKNAITARLEPGHGQHEGTRLVLELRADLFDLATAQDVADDLMATWLATAAEPGQTISALPVRSRLTSRRPGQATKPIDAAQATAPNADDVARLDATLIRLRDKFAQQLGLAQVGEDDNFFSLGGDSIMALGLVTSLRSAGIRCAPRLVFQHPTPRLLALALAAPGAAAAAPAAKLPLAPASNTILPIERWFFDLQLTDHHRWNQAVVAHVRLPLKLPTLHAALDAVHQAHAVFARRWHVNAVGDFTTDQDLAAPRYALFELDSDALDGPQIEAAAACINIHQGPLSVAAWHASNQTLVWMVHHLAVDAVSWFTLLTQLATGLSEPQGAKAPSAVASHSSRAQQLDQAQALPTAEALAQWRTQAQTQRPAFESLLALDCYAHSVRATARLPATSASTLVRLEQEGVTVEELMLVALSRLGPSLSGHDQVAIMLEQHGRAMDDEASEVGVGWHTAMAPIVMGHTPMGNGADQLAACITDLAEWRQHAASWLPCRAAATQAGELPWLAPTVSLNYLGRVGTSALAGVMDIQAVPDLPLHDPQGLRPFVHDVVCWQTEAGLELMWIGPAGDGPLAASAQCKRLVTALTEVLADLDDGGLRLPPGPLAPGLVYHHDQTDHLGHYLEQACADLRGDIDPQRMAQAWLELAQRHSALRTGFVLGAQATLLRRIAWQAQAPFEVRDLADAHGELANSLYEQAVQQQRQADFSLGQCPLWRVLLVRLAPLHWRLVFTHHHAILDGWSLPVLFEHLMLAYDAPGSVPIEACSQATMARAQVQANTPEMAREWAALLGGEMAPTRLALAPPGSGDAVFDQDLDLTLDEAMTERIAARAAQHGVSVSSWFLAAWALALRAFLPGQSVRFGMTVSGRDARVAGVQRYVGLAINTLPFVMEVPPELAFADLVRQAQQRSALVQDAWAMALPALARMAGMPAQELFEALFVFENYPVGALSCASFSLDGVSMREQAHYPLTLAVLPARQATLRLALRGGRVSEQDGQWLLAGLHSILERSSAMPWKTCSALRPMTPLLEVTQLGESPQRATESGNFYALLRQTSQRHPNAAAVSTWGLDGWRYSQLLAQAEQAAQGLDALGLTAGAVVAFSCRRSPAWLAALYGASAAGLAFFWLDPQLPMARRLDMLRQAGPRALLVDQVSDTDVLAEAGVPVVALASLTSTVNITGRPAAKAWSPAPSHPQSLAYLIFTSGTTGQPKLVAVPQAGLATLGCEQAKHMSLQAGDMVYQFASPSFDAVIAELLEAVCAGACLRLPRDGLGMTEVDLEDELRTSRASHITLPPSLIARLDPALLPDLRVILVAGEKSRAPQLQRMRQAGKTLINAYGPSEATVCATMQVWSGPDDPALGEPLAGVALRVLDSNHHLAAPRVLGQGVISGPALAWGYLGDARRTAERFVPDPYAHSPGQRAYLTGDLVFRDPSGGLHFVGRQDRQVKLRGQRIELGEVESLLQNHAAVLLARAEVQGQDNSAQLVAWIQPRQSEGMNLEELAHALAQSMPAGLLPVRWAVVSEWPLNRSGKVDAARLPSPQPLHKMLAHSSGGAAQTDDRTHQVLALWREILGQTVAPDADFTRAGGDSITAMRLASRLSATGFAVRARDLLTGWTPAYIASQGRPVAAQHLPGTPPDLNPTVTTGVLPNARPQDLAPASPIQQFWLQGASQPPGRWLLSVALDVRGAPGQRVAQAIAASVARHTALAARMDPAALQLHRNPEAMSLVVHCSAAERTAQHAAARARIDPVQGPGFAAVVSDGEEGKEAKNCQVLLAAHHLWIDVVSLRLLADDIAARLNAGALIEHPAMSFLDWSAALSKHTQAGAFDAQAAYWQEQLRPGPDLHTFAPARRPCQWQAKRCLHTIALPPAAWDRTASVLESLVLQALAQALAGAPGREILVELERHGRDALPDVDASGAVGWFTASFPLRLRATTNPFASAQALAARLQALPSGGAGFLALLAWRPQVLGQEACKTFAHDCRLAFNYLGELAVSAPDDHPETHAGVHITQSPQQPDDAHSDVDPQLERPRPVTVEAWTQGEALVLRATFDPADWPQGQASLEATAAVLADLLRHDPRLAPLPSLSDGELDSLMNELGI
jgi:amino acid adenylation domain-containing protein